METTILSPDHHGAGVPLDVMNRIVDLDRYPVHEPDGAACQALIATCQGDLDTTAASALHGFLRDDAIERARAEMNALVPQSYRFPNVPRKTFPFEDPEAEPDPVARAVRAMEHANSNNQILNYQIPNNSEMRALFLWPPLIEFIRRVRRVDQLHPSQCPHLALTAKVAFEGDTDGWHYDPNDGVVTLLLQAPDQGGGFEYAPNIRSDGDENYAGLKDLFEDPDQHGKRVEQRPGTLVFFNGRNSMHRVRPVGPTKAPRIVTIFSYDLRPTQVFGHSYVSMIHTLAQGAP